MEDIPLKVLIIDPDPVAAEGLDHVLSDIDVVLFVLQRTSLEDDLPAILEREDINTIIIDLIGLGIEAAEDFVFHIREAIPAIVFVLYHDFGEQQKLSDTFFAGERARLRHYFKLDKATPGPMFVHEVRDIVRACQFELYGNLTQEKITDLKKDLSSIQADATEETAQVPVQILKEIQELLSARQVEAKVANKINHPAAFLGELAPELQEDRCFLVMPYSQDWSQGVEAVVRESCTDAGFKFSIARKMDARYVPHDIWEGITGSAVIVADLTGANANVAYEVGLADAIGREVVLICQDDEVIPFDFLGQRQILYENTVGGALKLREELTERLARIKNRKSSPPR